MSEHDEKDEMIKNDTLQSDVKYSINVSKVIKASDLSGAALDWAVAKAIGVEVYTTNCFGSTSGLRLSVFRDDVNKPYNPSESWAVGGPIIESRRVTLMAPRPSPKNNPQFDQCWLAGSTKVDWHEFGETPLIAAMRNVVAVELGQSVEVPEELLLEVSNGA